MRNKKTAYEKALDALAEFELHELMEQHTLQQLKKIRKKFELHRKQLIMAIAKKWKWKK